MLFALAMITLLTVQLTFFSIFTTYFICFNILFLFLQIYIEITRDICRGAELVLQSLEILLLHETETYTDSTGYRYGNGNIFVWVKVWCISNMTVLLFVVCNVSCTVRVLV